MRCCLRRLRRIAIAIALAVQPVEAEEDMRSATWAQATFLRGPAAAAAPDATLQAELEALPQEALETRCRRSGLSRRGSRADMVRVKGMVSIPWRILAVQNLGLRLKMLNLCLSCPMQT